MINPNTPYKTLGSDGGWLIVHPVADKEGPILARFATPSGAVTKLLFHDRRAQPDKAFHWRTESEVAVYGPREGE